MLCYYIIIILEINNCKELIEKLNNTINQKQRIIDTQELQIKGMIMIVLIRFYRTLNKFIYILLFFIIYYFHFLIDLKSIVETKNDLLKGNSFNCLLLYNSSLW